MTAEQSWLVWQMDVPAGRGLTGIVLGFVAIEGDVRAAVYQVVPDIERRSGGRVQILWQFGREPNPDELARRIRRARRKIDLGLEPSDSDIVGQHPDCIAVLPVVPMPAGGQA